MSRIRTNQPQIRFHRSSLGMARYQQATALMAVDNLTVMPADDVIVKEVALGKITERKAIALLKQRYAINKFKRKIASLEAIKCTFKHSSPNLDLTPEKHEIA